MAGAYETGEYRNLFAEIGYRPEEIQNRLEEIFRTMFYGKEDERIYHPVEDDMGYLTDTGNNDVRTEGMSYGMMMCVQLNRKEEFDRIWKWTKTYMYLDSGMNKGYFAWSCRTDGTKNSYGPAPDGEEYFAMALFLLPIVGATERESSITEKKPVRFCIHAFIRGRTGTAAGRCGNLPIN